MVDKLDQSLDTIMTERRKTNRNTRKPRRAVSGAKPTTAPVGGIKKTTKPAKPAEKPTAAKGGASGDSKIIVSNLPFDVSETQIKDYFTQTVGPVKKVLLSYGPDGRSRGIANITFTQAGAAAQAAKELDNLKVDNRPMKIEVILGAKDAPAPVQPKSLSERVASQPKAARGPKSKAQPKPATAGKTAAVAGEKKGAGKKGARGRNAGRAKPKTAEELDAEMADYWDGGANSAAAGTAAAGITTNGGAVQPAAGEVAMDDGIM